MMTSVDLAGRRLVVTAEHGGNQVPPTHAELFRGREEVLASHRGWDPGTLDLSARLARRLDADRFTATVTRLLVDLNRSSHNPRVFSEITRELSRPHRDHLIEEWHRPHRSRVAEWIGDTIEGGRAVLHLGVHSFTPVFGGKERRTDLSLLYDPARAGEADLARAWTGAIADRLPNRAVRRNDPYRGAADGLTTWLRTLHTDAVYWGIEIEVNQRHLLPSGRFPVWVEDALVLTLTTLCTTHTHGRHAVQEPR